MTASRLAQEPALYLLHVVEADDTLEAIAYRILGDHMRWWEIADLNPQLMHTHCGTTSVLNLQPGDTIRVPS
jgi:nucleoid-associated protein YgaU